MPVTYQQLMELQRPNQEVHYTTKDSILYALSVGVASKGIDEAILPFVYENRPMRTIPSMATVLMRVPVPESGIDFRGLLHGEQRLTFHRPLPAEGTLIVDAGVSEVFDKGPEKGSVVLFESRARTPEGEPVFTTTTVLLARRDGGIGGPAGTLPMPHPIPERAPDLSIRVPTRPEASLLYRLNDDANPLHADPEVAKKAGFPAPILHGLATYGSVCAALVKSVCEGDSARMATFDARFASPVFPGEELQVDIWHEQNIVSFRCSVPARQQVVLDHGRCELRSV